MTEYYVGVRVLPDPCNLIREERLNLFIYAYNNTFEYYFNKELENKGYLARDYEILQIIKITEHDIKKG